MVRQVTMVVVTMVVVAMVVVVVATEHSTVRVVWSLPTEQTQGGALWGLSPRRKQRARTVQHPHNVRLDSVHASPAAVLDRV